MCQISAGKQSSPINTRCGCACSCPVVLPVAEEIRDMEDHKKILEDQLEVINRKISVLKTVKES
jgi:hypothetical protein